MAVSETRRGLLAADWLVAPQSSQLRFRSVLRSAACFFRNDHERVRQALPSALKNQGESQHVRERERETGNSVCSCWSLFCVFMLSHQFLNCFGVPTRATSSARLPSEKQWPRHRSKCHFCDSGPCVDALCCSRRQTPIILFPFYFLRRVVRPAAA